MIVLGSGMVDGVGASEVGMARQTSQSSRHCQSGTKANESELIQSEDLFKYGRAWET
jgi:hypothetical protein